MKIGSKNLRGKLMLVNRDFREYLPVNEKSNRGKFVNHTFKLSFLWDDIMPLLSL